MKRPKKNFSVASFVHNTNVILSTVTDLNYAEGIISQLEFVLHQTNNYNGFMFIDNNDSVTGTLGYYKRKYFKTEGRQVS